MAKNTETLVIKVDAETDQARRDLHALEEVADDITIKVDTDEAKRSIDDLLQDVDKLSSEDATIELKLAQQDLGRQLEAIRTDVEKLDASDATIDLKMEQGDALIGDIDKIESKLKEIDDQKVDVDVKPTTDNVGKLGDAADGAKSALANMVGNAAQDLGALGGVAGSAGVAVGQLAEYFADAKLDADNAGKSFGTLAKSFAPVLGPIVGIGAAVAIGTKLWGSYQAAQAEVRRQTDEVSKALVDLGGIVEQVNEDIAKQADVGDFGDKLLSSLTLTDEKIVKILGSANQLGISFTDVGDIIAGLGEKGDLQGFDLLVQDIEKRFGITHEQAIGVANAIGTAGSNFGLMRNELVNVGGINRQWIDDNEDILRLYGDIGQAAKDTDINKAAQKYLDTLELTADGLKQITDATERLHDQGILDPSAIQIASEISRGATEVARSLDDINRSAHESQQVAAATAQNWGILLDDLADGTIDTQAAADAWNILQTALGLTDDEMQALVDNKLAEKLDDDTAALEAAQKAADDLAAAIPGITQAISDLNTDDIDNIASALQDAFDASDGFIGHLKFAEDLQHQFDEALEESRKFGPDLRELLDLMAAGVTITPDITLGDLESDDAEFLAWVQSLQQMVQSGAVEAFKTGGTDAANAFVQAQAAAFLAANPELTLADFYNLVGLPPDGTIDALIKIAVDAEAKADALATLDTLIGVNPDDPILAFIKLQVQTGAIDPVIGEITALLLAKKLGVNVDPQLAEFTPEQIAEANAQIAAAGGVTVPVATEAPNFSASDAPLEGYYVEGIFVPVTTDTDISEATTTLAPLTDPASPRIAPIIAVANNQAAFAALTSLVNGGTKGWKANVVAVAKTTDADKALDTVAEERTANIKANPTNVSTADTTLDTLAMPTEDGRLAHIFAQPDNLVAAGAALDGVAHDRTANINVKADNAGHIGQILDAIAHDRIVHLRVQIDNYNEVERQLDTLARPRTQTITTRLGGSRNGAAVN